MGTNNETSANNSISVKIPALALIILVGIVSYRSGKKAGREECMADVAKITKAIVEEN